MRIVSFNINGVRARPHQLEAIVEQLNPDVIGLQEIKVHDDQFPHETFEHLGYYMKTHGQKGHYGVALFSKVEPDNLRKGWIDDTEDSQKRMIMGDFPLPDGRTLTIMNGYFPQGESRKHETKFPAKQKFYADLLADLQARHDDNPVVVMGDFNISPQDIDIGIGDVNRKRWLQQGKCSFLPEEREMYQAIMGTGLVDAWRVLNPDKDDKFSWFDYRSRGFEDTPKRGLRIDHHLISESLVGDLKSTGISYGIRAMEKPSDHCPIWIDIDA
ncbi:exodeoxyribonuclease III [Litorivicinus lipolyticus]|uniref:exodeoxyribonuclease III n=1 Tax=Litorivicinus lipolyticus TaxID=418701 RepID=UPI003B595B86